MPQKKPTEAERKQIAEDVKATVPTETNDQKEAAREEFFKRIREFGETPEETRAREAEKEEMEQKLKEELNRKSTLGTIIHLSTYCLVFTNIGLESPQTCGMCKKRPVAVTSAMAGLKCGVCRFTFRSQVKSTSCSDIHLLLTGAAEILSQS
jgi:hypothetical protein